MSPGCFRRNCRCERGLFGNMPLAVNGHRKCQGWEAALRRKRSDRSGAASQGMREELDTHLQTYSPLHGSAMDDRTLHEASKTGTPAKSPARKKPRSNEVTTGA